MCSRRIHKLHCLSLSAVLAASVIFGHSSQAQALDNDKGLWYWTYDGMNDAQLLVLSSRSIMGNILFAIPFGTVIAAIIYSLLRNGLIQGVLPAINPAHLPPGSS